MNRDPIAFDELRSARALARRLLTVDPADPNPYREDRFRDACRELEQRWIDGDRDVIEDPDELIGQIDSWAERVLDNGIVQLFLDPAFHPFWRGLQLNADLFGLFIESLAEGYARRKAVSEHATVVAGSGKRDAISAFQRRIGELIAHPVTLAAAEVDTDDTLDVIGEVSTGLGARLIDARLFRTGRLRLTLELIGDIDRHRDQRLTLRLKSNTPLAERPIRRRRLVIETNQLLELAEGWEIAKGDEVRLTPSDIREHFDLLLAPADAGSSDDA